MVAGEVVFPEGTTTAEAAQTTESLTSTNQVKKILLP